MDTKETIQQQFGPVAANYAASTVHAGGPDLAAMLSAVALHGDERLLDVGCGAGHTALAFAPRVAEVIGIDLTLAMLAQARRLARERDLSNVTFQQADVEQIPFPDGSFDLVTSRYSAHHYPHPVQALREIARVLKPGGSVMLVDVVAPADPASDTFLNAVELLRDPSHVRDHSITQWQAMLTAAGFESAMCGTWPLLLEFESWVARMNTPFLAITQIRSMFDGAARDIRTDLGLRDDNSYSFTVPVALIHGQKRG